MKKPIRVARLLFLLILLPAILLPALSFSASADETYTVTMMVQYGTEDAVPALRDDPETETKNYSINAKQPVGEDTPNVFSFAKGGPVWVEWISKKEGYSFDTWKLKNIATGMVSEVPDNSLIYELEDLQNDYIFTAVFVPNQYSLSYKQVLNDGDLYKGPEYTLPEGYARTHTYGETVTLPTPLTGTIRSYSFVEWNIYREGDKVWLDQRKAGATVGENEFPYDLLLIPVWSPNSFPVIRHDGYRAADGSFAELGTYTETEGVPYGTEVSAATFGGEAAYRGYSFDPATATKFDNEHPLVITVNYFTEGNENPNHIWRVYTPLTYTVNYDGCEEVSGSWSGPTSHVYHTDTVIPTPTRTGYTFARWEAVIAEGDDWSATPLTDNGDGTWTLSGDAYAGNASLTLRAVWTPNEYHISYRTETLHGNGETAALLPKVCKYDQILTIDAGNYPMAREGYTFLGWKIDGSDDSTCALPFVIAASTQTVDLTLEAVWQANTYTLTLDPVNRDDATGKEYTLTSGGTTSVTVAYDGSLTRIEPPRCSGFSFQGYYNGGELVFTPDGAPDAGYLVWKVASDLTLTAHWKRNDYALTIPVTGANGTDVSDQATILVSRNGGTAVPYDPAVRYPYESVLTVTVTVNDGFDGQLISRNGEAIPHAKTDTVSLTVGAGEATLSFVLLPAEPKPDTLRIDYPGERMTGLAAGTYRVTAGDAAWSFTLDGDGNATFWSDTEHSDPVSLSDVFGREAVSLTVIRCGDGSNTADSLPVSVALTARPAAPTDVTVSDTGDGSVPGLRVTLDDSARYEFALLTGASGTPVWQNAPVFSEGVHAGTPYTVLVRVRATDAAPHGEEFAVEKTTLRERFLAEWIERLNAEFLDESDGDHVRALISSAEGEAKALGASVDYEDQLDRIYESVRSRVSLERSRDASIAAVRAYYRELVESGAYDAERLERLNALLELSVAALESGTNLAETESALRDAQMKLDAVPMTHLSVEVTGGVLTVDSQMGFPSGTVMTAMEGDLEVARERLRLAMTASKETNAIPAETFERLMAMDLMETYTLVLASSDAPTGDTLTFRVPIPESLREESGLAVARYDSQTGAVRFLPSSREGNELVFTSGAVGSFWILCDHDPDPMPVIAALGCLILLQIIALAAILIGRNRRENRMYSVAALPLLASGGASLAVVALAVVALLLQIILTVLLASSALTRKRRERPEEPKPEPKPVAPVPEPQTGDAGRGSDGEADPATAPSPDEAEPANEVLRERVSEASKGNEVFDDENFIDPPANPSYSLPEE